jgi:hypothetical protein
MAANVREALLRYFISRGEVSDRRQRAQGRQTPTKIDGESLRLWVAVQAWSLDLDNQGLRKAVVRSVLRLARLKS